MKQKRPARPPSLDVYVDLGGATLHAGTATFGYPGGVKNMTDFAYTADYLADPRSYALDPRLPLYRSVVTVEGLPAAFADSTPDWWGRHLVTRTLNLEAANSGLPRPLITAVDFLTGVSDHTRQGNLRYAPAGTTDFLAPDATVPQLVDLPKLLAAADQVIADTDENVLEALKVLLRAGSATLGGARPKASVRAADRLYVAKFPHQDDEWDVMAWEKTGLDLAQRCGIDVPERELVPVGGRHVLLLARFDRDPAGNRLGYVSVRTLAEAKSSAGNDYLDMVAAIEDHSAAAEADLRAAWDRIAFTVAINNTDDHFHNHGFLRGAGGWVLSPAFDININPQIADTRATSLAGAALRADSLEMLVSQCAYFGLGEAEAKARLRHIADAIADWRDVARNNHIGDSELTEVGWVLDDYIERVSVIS